MGMVVSAPIGPRSSMGFPKTSMILPSVFSPTGTEIGALVLVTTRPLLRPSVMPMAIVLTIPSPSCCWTSNTVPVSEMTSAS